MNRLTTTAVALATLASVASASTVVTMDWLGDPQVGAVPAVSVGGGSFTFTGSGPNFELSDVTDFTLTVTRDLPSISFTSTFEYGLADLISLSGVADANGNILSLTFVTVMEQPIATNGFSGDFGFRVDGPSYGSIYFDDLGGIFDDVPGVMTYTTIPTPGAAAALAGVGVIGGRRRRG